MKVETYILKGWKTPLSGILVDENDKWILINNIISDYLLDGFTLIRKKYLLDRSTGNWEQQVKLVMKLRGYKPKVKLKLNTIPSMMDNISLKYDLFSFQDSHEDSLQIGIIEKFSKKNVFLRFIKRSGKLDSKYLWKYPQKSIRLISFNTDYLKSVKLLFEHRNK